MVGSNICRFLFVTHTSTFTEEKVPDKSEVCLAYASVWDSFHVTLLQPRIWTRFRDGWKTGGPLWSATNFAASFGNFCVAPKASYPSEEFERKEPIGYASNYFHKYSRKPNFCETAFRVILRPIRGFRMQFTFRREK